MSDWRHLAACLDEDPELFFPIGNTGPALKQIEDAKAVCHRCDVTDQCLAWALGSGQSFGVWGEMDEDERRALKRQADRAIKRYGPNLRAAAVQRFAEVRDEYVSDRAACMAVAEEFGIARYKTLMAWTVGCSAATRPGPKPDVELRARAVALVAQVRPHHRSEKSACVSVASRLGVHERTIGTWVREARAAAEAKLAGEVSV